MLFGSPGQKSEDGTNLGAAALNRDLCDVRDIVLKVKEGLLTNKLAGLKGAITNGE
jgi:hypothetical protein